jgi:long-chain fatty acid transport protein
MRAPVLALVASLSLCSSLVASPAHASGVAVARFGGEHGHPTTTNATAVYYNPAGIGLSKNTHLFVDLNLVWRTQTFQRPSSDTPEPADAQGANIGEAKLFNVLPAPGLGATTKLGDFALGAAIYSPMGGLASWKQNDAFKDNPKYPGPVDGVQRWWGTEGELIEIYTTLAAAYEVARGLSFGVSGSLIRSTANTIRARNGDGSDDIRFEGRSWLDVAGWTWGFGAGVLYEVTPDTFWIGASYTSKPDPFSNEMVLHGTLENNFGGKISHDDADLHQDLPDIYRLGVRYRPQRDLELRLFGDYTRWSQLERQCVTKKDKPCALNPDNSAVNPNDILQNQPRDWNDTFGVRVGASLWTNKTTELYSGIGYSSNAVPDSTLEPTLVDFHSITPSLGARFMIADWVGLDLSYTQFFWISRDNVGKSRLSKTASGTNQPTASRIPDAGGKYTQNIGALNVNADFEF